MSGYGFSSQLIYDQGAYKKEVSESTAPLHYRLYEGPFYNNNNCQNRLTGTKEDPRILIDLDSELSNRTRILSKDPKTQYPDCLNGACLKNNGYNLSPHLDATFCDRMITPTNIRTNISNGIDGNLYLLKK